MAVKVGINGFGRIGRNVLRASLGNPELDFVAVNDLTDPKTLAHLLKYDSILGNLHHDVQAGPDFVSIDGKQIKVFAERDPAKLDWSSVRIDRPLYGCDKSQGAPAGDGQEGHHFGSCIERRYHHRAWSQ